MDTRLPTIPRYFKDYIDTSIDLTVTKNIPCPIHGETRGKSFSYKIEDEIWRCFGACHTGGDVVELHRAYSHMKSREDAIKSLCALYHITYDPIKINKQKNAEPDKKDAKRRRVYAASIKLASDVEDWLELDYILSKVPYDIEELSLFCERRGFLF